MSIPPTPRRKSDGQSLGSELDHFDAALLRQETKDRPQGDPVFVHRKDVKCLPITLVGILRNPISEY